MEKFYLEIPSIEREKDVQDFLQEFLDYKSEINGSGGLLRLNEGMSYDEWVKDVISKADEDFAKKKGKVPATTYFTIREGDNKIVGIVNLRHYLNEMLINVGGHIGYSIRPTERRKGYAKIQLYLALLECKNLGLDEVMVDCIDSNLGSEKTIIALGGKFERLYNDRENDRILKNYWINVDESIEKYKDEYSKYVIDNKELKN